MTYLKYIQRLITNECFQKYKKLATESHLCVTTQSGKIGKNTGIELLGSEHKLGDDCSCLSIFCHI